jgi:hypothetical protein
MKLALRDLAPVVRQRLETQPRTHRLLAPPPKDSLGTVFGVVGITIGVWFAGLMGVGIVVGGGSGARLDWLAWMILVTALFGGPMLGLRWRRTRARTVSQGIRSDVPHPRSVWEVLLSDSAGSAGIYARSLLQLLALADDGRLAEAPARELLTEMNRLVTAASELEAQTGTVQRSASKEAVAVLQLETSDLARRVAGTVDEPTRRMLEQALATSQGRLENAQTLLAQSERLDARRESVRQNLLALEETLVRYRLAGTGSEAAEDPLHARLVAMQREALATEDAVAEVNRLGL